MQKLTNPFNRDLEHRFRKRVAREEGRDLDNEKRLDLEDIKRRIATYRDRWGEDPEL